MRLETVERRWRSARMGFYAASADCSLILVEAAHVNPAFKLQFYFQN